MVPPGEARPRDRGSTLAGSASLALHGGVLVIVAVFAGRHAAEPPRPITSTAIEVVGAAPPPQPHASQIAAPIAAPTIQGAGAGTRARRQQVRGAQPSAPAAKSSFADLSIGYDDPTNFAEKAATTVDGAGGIKRSAIGGGVDREVGDGIASMQVPRPVSLARPARPRFDYTNLRLNGASQFAGRTIKVQLVIDIRGRVREVRLLQGVDRDLDRRTIALVHGFEYEPALDDDGAAIPGTALWNIQIVEDTEESPFRTLDRLRL